MTSFINQPPKRCSDCGFEVGYHVRGLGDGVLVHHDTKCPQNEGPRLVFVPKPAEVYRLVRGLTERVAALEAELAEARGGCRTLEERLWEINDRHVEGYHRD